VEGLPEKVQVAGMAATVAEPVALELSVSRATPGVKCAVPAKVITPLLIIINLLLAKVLIPLR